MSTGFSGAAAGASTMRCRVSDLAMSSSGGTGPERKPDGALMALSPPFGSISDAWLPLAAPPREIGAGAAEAVAVGAAAAGEAMVGVEARRPASFGVAGCGEGAGGDAATGAGAGAGVGAACGEAGLVLGASSATMAAWPQLCAASTGAAPALLRTLGSAPRSRSMLTILRSPRRAAACRGVSPAL